MKFPKSKKISFEKVGIKGWNYNLTKKFGKLNICLVETKKGHKTVIKSTKSNWIYFVIEGKGKFFIDGKVFSVKKEDVIIVKKNKPFFYQGSLKMLLITIPPWEEKYEVTLGKVKDLNDPLIKNRKDKNV